MSLLRMPKFQRLASALERLRGCFTPAPSRSTSQRAYRRLLVDPLEERQLLSVAPANVDDTLINEALSDSQFTYAAHGVDADHDGDFVAAWTRYDDVLDPLTGDPLIDPETGLIMTDANVYARYFTDEVQRLTLPEEVLGDQVATQYASFALQYGGNEVQKISVTASYEPFVLMQENLEGSFTLGFDLDRNDIISGSETTTIVFDETPPPDVSTAEHLLDLAETIQTGLQGLGGELNDVTVEALNPHEYLVYFGAASGGLDQPQITVEDFTFSAGFLPAVMTSTVREPADFADIPVSPDNPNLTALAIEQSFLQSSVNFPIPPTDFPPPSRVPSTVEGPYFVPEVMRTAVPEVTVTPVLGVRNLDVQILTFDANTAGALTGPFLLSIDGFTTGQIDFDSTDLPTVAGDIQAQLAGLGYAGVAASVLSATDPYQFEIEFVAGTEPPLIEYVPVLDGFGDPLLDAEVDAKYDTYDGTIFDIAFTGDSGKKDHPELLVTAVEDEYGVSLITSPQLGVQTLKEPSPEFRVNPEEPDNPFTILPDRYDQINPSVAMDADGEFVITWESEVPNIDNFGSVSDIFARRFTAAGLVDPADVTYFTDTDADGLVDSPVQGVRAQETPLELRGVGVSAGDPYTFRVNEFTTNAQYQPHVDMDDAGNFVVAWANEGQDVSFFNGIVARRFNRYGEPLGSEWLVNVEDTGIHIEPYVAMSSDGHFLVTWSLTHDPDYLIPDAYTASVQAEVYSPEAAVLMEQFAIPAAGRPTADFDMMNRFVISWDELADTDNFGWNSEGTYGLMYELYDDAGEVSGNIIRDIFRASSASFDLGSNPLWPDWQGMTQAALDADGDLVITYEGFGPDVSEDVYSFMDLTGAFADALGRQINVDTNADLLVFFDPEVDTLPLMNFDTDPSGDTRYSNLGADIDAAIEEVLINASVLGATDAQLGRLRAILDETAGLLRGDAWGMMFSRFDADPLLGPLNTLYSDSIANAHRDGHNERYIITLDEDTSGGSFTMRFYNRGAFEDVTVNVVVQNGVLQPWATAEAINNALEAATLTGVNWPEGIPVYEGPVDVRVLSTDFWNAELLARQGTDWELPFVLDTDYIFEVTFQGELHDTPLILSMAPGGNNLTADPVAEVQYLYINATADGWFALDFDGNTTGDMLWDSTSPGALAGTIENQLDGAGAADVQVVYMGTTIDGYEYYEVTFAGDSSGVNQPPVQQAAAQDHAAPEHAIFAGNIWSQEIIQGASPDAVWPYIFSHTAGTIGTPQVEGSIGMEPDGDFVVAWTQYDLFTDGTYANNSIHYRRFDEDTDTAGPMVSDLVLPDGTQVDDGETIEVDPDGVSHLILVFDEDMMAYDDATLEWAIQQRDLAEETGDPVPGTVKAILDTVTNPENYRLFKNGVEVADGIVKVEFGMNKAADLADEYGLNPIPSNKWEAVLTVDGNGVFPGVEPLGSGLYTIQALAPITETDGTAGQSGLRDKPGNPLNYTGYQERGGDFSRDFILTLGNQSDDPVTDPPPGALAENGRTYPETPGAVAVDGDGDHIVAWTAFDSSLGRDRAFVRMYEADGTPAPTAPFFFQATPVAQFPEFGDVDQRYATVACDEDGDFVVTWTQYDPVLDAQGHEVIDPLSGERLTETNIYARRYYANGLPKDDGPLDGLPFRVNTYTANNQKWSNVDMDTDGDFVVTWSSYGQEDNGQMGLGYGVYARQFDSLGQPIAPEFQVNVTTAGNQQFSSVAVDSIGGFVVAWTSDQNGIGDDIITRSFNSDGSPQEGLLGGELRVNQIVDGNQRYPDVDMNLAGTQFVITWSSSGEDGSGWGVYGRMFAREPAENVSPFKHYPSDDVPLAVPDSGFTILSTLDVPDSFLIRDLTVQLDLITPDPEDMIVRLISPGGTNILLFDDVPEPMQGGARPPGRDFIGTILDDEAAVDITDSDTTARPPFTGPFVPEEDLATFDQENAFGTWILSVTDITENHDWFFNFAEQRLERWSIQILPDPAAGNEFLVNTTRDGNQMFSSVAMDYNGEFTITWSGIGEQLSEEDDDYGVFYQRFDPTGAYVGDETRVNITTEGSQWIPSIETDADGNFVIAWTGVGPLPGTTDVYKFSSLDTFPMLDGAGPIVTDVFDTNHDRVLQGDVLEPPTPGVTELIVAFNEELSQVGGSEGLDSVLNPHNWSLERNGTEIPDAISAISFERNISTRKWEATLTLDGNGITPGVPALAPGDYVLTVRDLITDTMNALDGDFDGLAGTNPASTGQDGYKFQFAIADGPQVGAEFRINDSVMYEERFSQAFGIGFAREETTRSVAIDHDGDFAVVWTSYGQDGESDPNDPNYDPNFATNGGVYLRLFDRDNNSLTGDILVNTTTIGNQRNAAVAMDADGDFVVAWESEGHGGDDSWDVFGQRYNAVGQPVGGEFLVNTETANNQINPAVAMDNLGNFAVVWATAGQDFSYFSNVQGQVFDFLGRAVGEEFRVNEQDIPGTSVVPGSTNLNPAVAMNGNGDFAVVWDVVQVQVNGVITDTNIIGRLFDRFGNPKTNAVTTTDGEFQVDESGGTFTSDPQHTPMDVTVPGGSESIRTARNPSITMDEAGNFIVAWEAYRDNDVDATAQTDSYGIYFRRFQADATPDIGSDHQANLTITSDDPNAQVPDPDINGDKFAYDQVNPSVAMDIDGDYVITWNGNGAEPHPLDPLSTLLVADDDAQGVWVRSFHADPSPDAASTELEYVTVQTRVNRTEAGIQQFPTIAMEPDGDHIIVWNGNGVGDRHGIFARRYDESTDTAGPLATELRLADGSLLVDAAYSGVALPQIVVVFDEQMSVFGGTAGAGSVLNPANWTLRDANGQEYEDHIHHIDFGLNMSHVLGLPGAVESNKWEAVITFDGNGLVDGSTITPLPDGFYELIAGEDLEDAAGNKLRHSGYLPGYRSDELENMDEDDWARRTAFEFSVLGTPQPGTEFLVNQSPDYYQTLAEVFETGSGEEHSTRSVAVDHDGDFVVVWTSYGQDDRADTDGAGVYMRMFDRDNVPLTNEFQVNTTVEGDQWRPAVAIDADGEFVVVWQSDEQDADGSAGIYARRFSSIGDPLGGEFRVNTNYTNDQYHPAVAMDDDGNFTVVWGTAGQTLSYFNDIMGQMFNREGERLGSEFRVNTTNVPGIAPAPGGGNEVAPAIGMNGSGNFLVAWEQVTAQENGVVTDTEVVARAFDPDGTPAINPISGDDLEFRVDTAGGQGAQGVSEARTARNPQVAVDEQGNFYVSYEFYTGTPGVDGYYSTFTELMMADASTPGAWAAPALPIILYGEPDYVNPTLAVDADGDWGIVLNGHYAELDVQAPTNPLLVINEDMAGAWLASIDAANELISTVSRVNQTGYGDQRFPCIAMEPDGDSIIVWSGYGVGDDQGVFARRYDELTDTAGPTVTDYLLPSGVRIAPDMQITEPLTHIVVVFDEEMLDVGLDAVTNPDNYHLLKSGVPIEGGISYVDFGLNPGTNKWEAVLHLDGNGVEPGTPPILEGQLELVCMNSLRDVAGNPLASTGLLPDGEPNSQRIDVIVPDGEEIRVNFPDGEEHTYPHGQPAVAADADGDYVVVWTDEAQSHLGVYAKLYDVDWTDLATGRVSTVAAMPVRQPSGAFWPNNEILVTGDPTASYAAVARDIDGDFVVTWSQWSAENDWDIYARRYDAAGNALTGPFLVNSETENIQQFSSVAMDGDGDFVITWQSYNQEDNDSYDIYAQRYSPEGYAIDGSDELQMLEFVGNPTGTFVLRWDHDKSPYTADLVTGAIPFVGNTFDTAQHIENALVALGADVDVEAFSLTEIAVRFVGADGGKDQAPLAIDPTQTHLTGDPGAQIIITTRADGSAGEFRVNDTIENHQMWPSIDISTNGNFVISWTSFGQGDDLPYESDIYAKRFPANDVIWGHNPNRPTSAQNLQTSARIDGAHYQPLIVSVDDPVNHEVGPGVGYDGVVQVFAGMGYGSGTVLTGGNYVLTASHVVWDDLTGAPIDPSLVQVAFDMPAGRVMMPAWDVFVAPGYNGDPFEGGDVAVVMLAGSAPAGVETHDIYRASDELGRLGDKYGYGLIGTGNTGYTTGSGDLKRSGWNRYETLGSMVGSSDELLVYDFDNGLPENDALGQVFGINNLGEGLNEICAAPGDSGGPTFIDGKVAAVTTGMVQMPGPHDVVPGTNASFGDFGMDTRVSLYADWIDSITSFGGYEFRVNENDPLLDDDGIQVVDDDGNPVFIDNDGSNQKWSSVALDANGDFVITWTSYGHDGVGSGYGAGADGLNGIFARRYEVFNPGIPWNDAFQVNSFAEYDQQYSRVAMDADGDFVITWESFQDRPESPLDDTPNSFGIYAQRYVRSELIGQEAYGPDGELGGELEVNSTKAGDQRYPGVAMDDAGDFVIVWSGNGEVPGQQDDQGVFSRRYDKSADEAGPTVGDVLNVVVDGSGNIQLLRVLDGAVLQILPTQFVLTLGEEVSTEGIASGTHSIMNPYNWQLTKDGAPVAGGVREVRGPNLLDPTNLLNPATQKYEAVVTFDGDPLTAGLQPLERGVYVLTLKDSVEDIFENPLDGDFDGKPQVDFARTFSVLTAMPGETEPGTPGAPGGPSLPGDPDPESEDVSINTFWEGDQDNPVVASNDDGDHVVIWVTHNDVGEGTIRGQRFNRLGQPEGNEFVVSTFSSGNQIEPDVAMDRFGNFVVTWSGVGEVDEAGVFARVFDPYGEPLGEQFRVNQERNYIQDAPTVAMDANGDFVVVWTTFGAPEGDRNLFARRFTFLGEPLGNEFQVNTTMLHGQDDSDVAMDHDGNFVVVWNSWSQDGGGWSVIGRRFNSSGVPLGSEFRVNQHATDNQHLPQVAMDADGDFVVVWQSWLQDGSQYGTYARRYDRAGTPAGSEFLVNQTTAYAQRQAAVSMANDGRFVVTWTSFGQDNQNINQEDDGVYARIYNPDGSDYLDLETGLVMGEFRVNATEEGNQHSSAVAMDADGDFVVAWVAPSTQPVDPESDIDRGDDIYRRVVALNPASYYGENGGSGGFLAGGYLGGDGGGNPGPATVVVTGTAGDDSFEFVGAATPGAWIVRLNGQAQNVGANAVAVVFDGLGGNDTVSLSGTGGNDVVELWGDHGTLTGDGYSVSVSQVETITAEGLGGDDHATLHDSAGNDEFISWPFGAMMVTAAANNTVTGFDAIVGNAGNGGYDKARFYDSPGNDTFITVPSYGLLSGEGYSNQAVAFDEVHAYATGGGYDITRMYDSPGDDTFYATPLETALYGDGFFNRAKYFKEVHGYASAGGEDVGLLFDSDGNDTFYATPTEGAMYGDGYFNRAKFFEKMRGDASLGGSDSAVLYDSLGQDLFIASPTFASLNGDGFDNQATNFDDVLAYATLTDGFYDQARLYDSPGDDLFWTTPTYGALMGNGFYNQAAGFDGVNAYGFAGGHDTAKLYDSAGDDTFYATAIEGMIWGPGFYHRAKNFEVVSAFATAGGIDEAHLFDSAGNDVFYANSVENVIFNDTFYNRAKFFENVYAHSETGGVDTAYLFDAVLEDGSDAKQATTTEGQFTKIAWLYEFEELYSTEESADEPVLQAVDAVIEAYWP